MKLALFAVSALAVVVGYRTQPTVQDVGEVIQLSDTTLEVGSFQECNRDHEIIRPDRSGVIRRRSAYFSEAWLFAHLAAPGKRTVVVTRPGFGRFWEGGDAEKLIRIMEKYGCLSDSVRVPR